MKTEIDGITLNYLDEGKGIPVVLLHGWGCNCGHWGPVTAALKEKYRVIVPDIPGFGESSEPPEVWNTQKYAEFFAKFFRELGIEKPVLAGHSNGGRISIVLGAMDLCSRILLTDSAGIKPKRSVDYYVKVYSYKAMKKALSLPGLKNKKDEILEKRRKKSGSADYQAASPRMRQILSTVVNEDLTTELAKIRVPTLLVWGSEDADTPLSDGEAMERILKKSGSDTALIVFQGRTHYAFLEEPSRFNRIFEAFIQPMEVK
ncbi:MAG: alpha/beta hydrolase [Bacillota bacterium]|nr:alpha/beta hydrolase [Bacillota bacterium]